MLPQVARTLLGYEEEILSWRPKPAGKHSEWFSYVVEGATSPVTWCGYRGEARVLSYHKSSDRLLREGDQE
jgi:hypothetical protein